MPPPVLADFFTPDGFGLVALTAAIQKLPPAPNTLAQLGVFREIPIAQISIAIESRNGVLMLVPTTARG